jgi:hypothetical protein
MLLVSILWFGPIFLGDCFEMKKMIGDYALVGVVWTFLAIAFPVIYMIDVGVGVVKRAGRFFSSNE